MHCDFSRNTKTARYRRFVHSSIRTELRQRQPPQLTKGTTERNYQNNRPKQPTKETQTKQNNNQPTTESQQPTANNQRKQNPQKQHQTTTTDSANSSISNRIAAIMNEKSSLGSRGLDSLEYKTYFFAPVNPFKTMIKSKLETDGADAQSNNNNNNNNNVKRDQETASCGSSASLAPTAQSVLTNLGLGFRKSSAF